MIESAVPSINESMKMIALNLFDTLQPSDVFFGEVIKTNPLEIMIDQKNIIPAQYLVLTNMVKDHPVDMTISMQTEDETEHVHVGNLGAPTSATAHKHEIKGTKKITLHYGLKVGESVILIRLQGGQRYVVLDRVEVPRTGGEWL